MVRIQNISKSYGARTLFSDVTFNINQKEKIGLVGRNGHGKSTLFKILTGEEHADTGEIEFPNGYRSGFLQQNLKFGSGSVRDEAASGLRDFEKDELWKAERILMGLGFTQQDMDRKPAEFSGGYQIRIHLAKILLSEPDLLLLDEPTNYLDITSIRWLEQYLREWPRELMLITHDRAFMDNVVTHSLAIHRGKIRKIKGDTGAIYEQIVRDEEIYEKTRLNDEKRVKEMEVFISRFRAKARLAGMVQSRMKMIEKMDRKDRLEKIEDLDFSFNYRQFDAKVYLRVEDLSFGYSETPLFSDLSFNLHKGDRLAVIGRNGKGKTTLLKVIAGELEPGQGAVEYHNATATGYYEQSHTARLSDNNTVEDEILLADRTAERTTVRNICGTMMFEGDDALKKIHCLSGGEKARVLLGRLLLSPVNVLLLDEPTNHLDMQASDSLLQAIDMFEGGVIMVTHNEMFLRALANRLIVFDSNGAHIFEGGYEEFLEKEGWENERPAGSQNEENLDKGIKNKKELRRERSRLMQEKNSALKPLALKIEKLERDIAEGEENKTKWEQELIDASANGNGTRIQELSRDLHSLAEKIDNWYDELCEASATHEQIEKDFDERIAEFAD